MSVHALVLVRIVAVVIPMPTLRDAACAMPTLKDLPLAMFKRSVH